MDNLYILTNNEYVNLQNVSFVSNAPTEVVQNTLGGNFKMKLTELLNSLNAQGYKSEDRKNKI